MPVTKQIWARVKPETHQLLTKIARRYNMKTSTYLRRIVEKLCGQYEEPLMPNEIDQHEIDQPSHDDSARRKP